MHLLKHKSFGPVDALESGYGPLGPPWMTVHLFHLEGVLIDTGQHHMQRWLLEALNGYLLSRILLTHHHEDHSGNAAVIGRRHRIGVFGHPIAAAKMRRRFRILPYQQYTWGKARPVEVGALDSRIETEHFRLTPIHTPGHSRDHTVYLEKSQGWLFAGDLFLGERIKYFRSDEKLPEQIQSLKTVLGYDFEALFCAHRPCFEGGRIKLIRKLEYLEDFFGRVQAMKQEGMPCKAVVRALDPRHDRWIRLITTGNVSFANMVRSAYYDRRS
jgi:glyoxylase-like metal-dependent hydrolase (beta-lactamase superfamily II)